MSVKWGPEFPGGDHTQLPLGLSVESRAGPRYLFDTQSYKTSCVLGLYELDVLSHG